jgi:cytosine/adenosine deaminase-related metal-dependent hydrolase
MPYPEATTLYRARHLLPMGATMGMVRSPIENGGIAVRGGEIVAVECWTDLLREHPGAIREDLGEVILMPGLINAHCHLDYGMMRGALFGGESFSAWIQRLNGMRRSLDQSDYLDSIAAGLDELRHWGCTTVFNIESFPELLPFLPESPIRVWWFLEVLDIRSRLHSAEALTGAVQFFEKAGEGSGGFGISPHAPYTASRDLYNLAGLYAEKYKVPLCTHLAESEEEMAMFTKGEGALYEFLRSIGRSMDDCAGMTPVQIVLGAGLIPKGSLLVHMNLLSEGDREFLKGSATDYPVIHCPRTHAFFNREPFDLKFFSESRIPVLIGTDSLASNQDLNMFAEMRAMESAFPELDPMDILSMVTNKAAAAIGRSGWLGELSPGALADFIAIPDDDAEGDMESLAERVLANRMPPRVWVSGRS